MSASEKLNSTVIKDFFTESRIDRADLRHRVSSLDGRVTHLAEKVQTIDTTQQAMGMNMDRLTSVIAPIERLDRQREVICMMAKGLWKGGIAMIAIAGALVSFRAMGWL